MSSAHEKRYASDLQKSFEAMNESASNRLTDSSDLNAVLEKHLDHARDIVRSNLKLIQCSLTSTQDDLVREADMLPRISPASILSHLAGTKVHSLPPAWKTIFVQYGRSIATLQRAERLFADLRNPSELVAGILNKGHQNWDPEAYPEWLLLEVENNILIRPEQADIAREMMRPSSGGNAVMQLNMVS